MSEGNSTDDQGEFGATLRAGSDEFGARVAPLPAAAVRARGNSRRTRRRVTATLAAAAATAVVVTGAHALAGPSGDRDVLPAAPTSPSVTASQASPTTSPADSPSPPAASASGNTAPSARSSASASSTPGRTGTAAPGGTTASGTPDAACRSRAVPAATKSAVTDAFRANAGLTHVAPAPGTFYYGTCGTTAYAASRFQPTSGATTGEQVQLQDEGAAMKYFTLAQGGTWRLVASDGFPRDARGCAAVPQIPKALAAAWSNCPLDVS
ncbi:hypothetical protein ACIQU5_26030 [Streptomyces sp. NPDC090306]|uniref:hypothetical protein n=1 Tax=Streptomyces sp. NPDC090306 TaxID=3365961 RepID=UPI003823FACE